MGRRRGMSAAYRALMSPDSTPSASFTVQGPPPPAPEPRDLPADYRRPDVSVAQYLDEQGELIPYGHRWGVQPPPEDMYTVMRHPQRFVPLVDLARTLIDYLSEHYQLNIIRDEGIALEPAAGAALRFQLEEGGEVTGVRIEAGLLAQEVFPACGCDACDEDVPQLLDDLEDFVFAVVQGDFAEWREGRWIHHGIYLGDTLTRSSGHKITDRGQWARVKSRAKELPGRHAIWPRR